MRFFKYRSSMFIMQFLVICTFSCAGIEYKEDDAAIDTRIGEVFVGDEEGAKSLQALESEEKAKAQETKRTEAVVEVIDEYFPAVPETLQTKRRFELTLGVLGNKTYGGGDYAAGAHVNYSTSLGPGIKLAGEYFFNDKSSIYTQFLLMSTPLDGTFTNFTVTQDSSTTKYWDLGYRYTFGKYFSLRGFIGIRQDYIFHVISSTRGSFEQFWHGLLGVGGDYSFYKRGKFSLDGGTDLVTSLGTTTSTHQTKTGFLFGTELRPTFEYSYPFFALLRFEYFRLNDNLLTSHNGKVILFGLGCKFKFRPEQ